MNKILLTLIITVSLIHLKGQVGIEVTTPHPSAALEIGGDKGVLFPRLTTSQRNSIVSPAKGLMVFNTDSGCFETYDGNSWNSVCPDQEDCDYAVSVSTEEIFMEVNQTESFNISISSLSGAPGIIQTTFDNLSSIPGLVVNSISQQAGALPKTQSVSISLNSSTIVGSYNVRLRHTSTCGVEKFSNFILHVTGCDATVSLSSGLLSTPAIATTLSTTLQILQAGSSPTTATTQIIGSYAAITPSIVNNNCSITCSQTLSFTLSPSIADGSYSYLIETTLSCGTVKTTSVVIEVGVYRSCKQILDAGESIGDGIYNIDPDGPTGTLPLIPCYCDMTTDGGGWTLVLNYFRSAGPAVNLNIMNASLPIPTIVNSSSTFPGQFLPLGGDESSDLSKWGHASTSLMNFLPFDEMRFCGRTTNQSRIIHFKTSAPSMKSYFKSGTGSVNISQLTSTSYTQTLSSHTANLPFNANAGATNQGNLAMTNIPFQREYSVNIWGLNHGNYFWSADDNKVSGLYQSTIHQIWIR